MNIPPEQYQGLVSILRAYARDNPQYTSLDGDTQDPNGAHALLNSIDLQQGLYEEEIIPEAKVVKMVAVATLYSPKLKQVGDYSTNYHASPDAIMELPINVEKAEAPYGSEYGRVMVEGRELNSGIIRICKESIPFLIEAYRMHLTILSEWPIQ